MRNNFPLPGGIFADGHDAPDISTNLIARYLIAGIKKGVNMHLAC